jgi:hypothetical protein
MPLQYIILHIALSVVGLLTAFLAPGKSLFTRVAAAVMVLIVVLGFLLERNAEWAWYVMSAPGSDLIFLTNYSLEATTLLSAVLWRTAQPGFGRVRAVILSTALLSVGIGSYSWYFRPVPPGLVGKVDKMGYCRQTSEDSCSAAAAVMLLHRYGVTTTEAEMAELSLTRQGLGTPLLGLFRGLALKSRDAGLHPEVVHPRAKISGELVPIPSILYVGVKRLASASTKSELEKAGFRPGTKHAVVAIEYDPDSGVTVADPSVGVEVWDDTLLKKLWDGRSLVLRK